VADTVALHWITFFGHVHGHMPCALNEEDRAIVCEIVSVQCFNDEAAACALIEEIVRAPVIYASLTDRYAEFWAWTDSGRPKKWSGAPLALVNDCLACIRTNLRGAA
jgi:hypothetical protein